MVQASRLLEHRKRFKQAGRLHHNRRTAHGVCLLLYAQTNIGPISRQAGRLHHNSGRHTECACYLYLSRATRKPMFPLELEGPYQIRQAGRTNVASR